MIVWRSFMSHIKGINVTGIHLWTCNCYKTRIELKINSLIRRKKNHDILRYKFRIAIRYKFFAYCDISIYCDTPIKNTVILPYTGKVLPSFNFRPLIWGQIQNRANWIMYKGLCHKIGEWANSKEVELVSGLYRAKIRLGEFKAVYVVL